MLFPKTKNNVNDFIYELIGDLKDISDDLTQDKIEF
jgi:hypothetical protein